jgi:UDP-glucose 4-epimerase
MKVLVTGGAGFIGSHIVDECISQGYQVVIIDNLASGFEYKLNQQATFYNMDITDPGVHDVIKQEGIEAIIHQAAQSAVPPSMRDPKHDAKVNIIGTINLLEAVRHFGIKKFVFASSAAIYGVPDTVPIAEEHPLRPLSFYGLSKKVDEEYVRMYAEYYGVNYTMFRYANVYGPRQGGGGEQNVITIFMEKMLTGGEVQIQGDGGATRDFIYVGDVAKANVAALTSPVCATVNLSTQTQVTVNKLFRLMAELTGYKKEAAYVAPRVGDIYHSSLKNEKVLNILPWTPQVTLEEGLNKTIAWGKQFYGNDAH